MTILNHGSRKCSILTGTIVQRLLCVLKIAFYTLTMSLDITKLTDNLLPLTSPFHFLTCLTSVFFVVYFIQFSSNIFHSYPYWINNFSNSWLLVAVIRWRQVVVWFKKTVLSSLEGNEVHLDQWNLLILDDYSNTIKD